MNDQATLEREQPTITRGEGIFRNHTIVAAYGHQAEIQGAPQLVRLNAPSLFADPEWRAWLNHPQSGPATWHARGEEPGDYSDVFIHYGGAHWDEQHGFIAEGSDYPSQENRPGIPDRIYALLAEAVREATGSSDSEVLLWISNLGAD